MPVITFLVAVLLVAIGLGGYIASGTQAPTALIPAGLGAVLARRLHRDAERLREAEEDLRKTKDELEQGVRERTTALESANAIA